MANSQHRCVFVGNIPYDATEEQLVQICEEVGPVVSFRLVIDRETGKPKGYGFCEYKDEETALSARRNLHGYDINGRQLRVDFAENDKNNERSREQGRGGPGITTNTVPQKQIGGPAVHGDLSLQQAVGHQDAMAAAIVMAGALGGGQTNNNISQNGIRSQPILGNDPLTLHLAKMPKGQLTEVLTELKAMATQNKEEARQLLLAHPQLSKAVLQAHIMLKSVPPHLLQMPNAPRQVPVNPALQGPPQALLGLPPLAQNKVPHGFLNQSQSQSQTTPLVPTPYAAAASVPMQPRFQTPQSVLQHSTLSGLPASGNIQSLLPQQAIAASSSMLQYPNLGLNAPLIAPVQPSHPLLQENVFKPSSSIASSIPNNGNKDQEKSQLLSHNPTWGHKVNHHPNFVAEKDQISQHPSKMLKMEDGRGASFLTPDSQKQNHELPAGVESALLQQVLNLTPEQLSSLPPEQQQQVIQLQQMLRQST